MKHWITAALILVSYASTFGQDRSQKLVVNEVKISSLLTVGNGYYAKPVLGIGVGIHHNFKLHSLVGFVMGVEYNRVRYFNRYENSSHFGGHSDVSHNLSYLSLPASFRIQFGENSRFFMETGFYADLLISARKKGTSSWFTPVLVGGTGETIVEKFNEVEDQPHSYGVSFGFGIMIPIANHTLYVKPEYKAGFPHFCPDYDEFSNRYFGVSVGLKIFSSVKPQLNEDSFNSEIRLP